MSVKETTVYYFFYALLVFILAESMRLFLPFLAPILCAIAVGVICYPIHHSFYRHMKGKSSLAAVISTIVVVLLILLPLWLVGWRLVTEADSLAPLLQKTGQSLALKAQEKPVQVFPAIRRLPLFLQHGVTNSLQSLPQRLGQAAGQFVRDIGLLGAAVAKHGFRLLLDIVIFIFVLFFIFRDGLGLWRRVAELLPLQTRSKERLEEALHATMVGTIRGNFLTWGIQALVAGIGFVIVKNPVPLLLSLLTFAASIIPSTGAPLVWGPVAIYYLATGAVWKGVFLIAWGFFIVGLADHLLRPYLIGRGTHVSFLWVFFSLLGGLETFGLIGLILGPMLITILAVLLEIYRSQFLPAPS